MRKNSDKTKQYEWSESDMSEFKFEIEEHLIVLSENEKGWKKELTRVSWNGAPAKFDIRQWSPDYSKMGKGVTLTNEEFQKLVEELKK
ncbi:seryl-tRNA synthetase [Lactococcus plantarum]|uniref:Seryl-tRNA synthetase n=2 Tax=Pseudolactococcus plantarum TaxID=1365 RepID=A0A2A5S3H7_9LACT|nr:seryl-tRNA synthetase [Lactococcus plantarum]